MTTKGQILQEIARLRYTLVVFDEVVKISDTMPIEEQLKTYKNAYKSIHKMLDTVYASLEELMLND